MCNTFQDMYRHAALLRGEVATDFDVHTPFRHNSQTPLMVAAATGSEDAVSMLLRMGARVDARHPYYGTTALHEASSHGHTHVCHLLLEHGAAPDATGHRGVDAGCTPLVCAAARGHGAACLALLPTAAPVHTREALRAACAGGHSDVARLLLDLAKSPPVTTPAVAGDMLIAAAHGPLEDEDVLSRLLALTRGSGRGRRLCATALRCAAARGHVGMLRTLCHKGAANVSDDDPTSLETPLTIAAMSDRPRVCACLVDEFHVPVDERNRLGQTPLFVALYMGGAAAARTLLRRGACLTRAMCHRRTGQLLRIAPHRTRRVIHAHTLAVAMVCVGRRQFLPRDVWTHVRRFLVPSSDRRQPRVARR